MKDSENYVTKAARLSKSIKAKKDKKAKKSISKIEARKKLASKRSLVNSVNKKAARVLNVNQIKKLSKDFEVSRHFDPVIEEDLIEKMYDFDTEDFLYTEDEIVETTVDIRLEEFAPEFSETPEMSIPFKFDTAISENTDDSGEEFSHTHLLKYKDGLFTSRLPLDFFKHYDTIPESFGFKSKDRDPNMLYIDTDAGIIYVYAPDSEMYQSLSEIMGLRVLAYYKEEAKEYHNGESL